MCCESYHVLLTNPNLIKGTFKQIVENDWRALTIHFFLKWKIFCSEPLTMVRFLMENGKLEK